MRFIVTTHARLDGARLSCPGHWGNLPFPDAAAAEAEARRLARGSACAVEFQHVRSRRATA